jgi:hypothetical protein
MLASEEQTGAPALCSLERKDYVCMYVCMYVRIRHREQYVHLAAHEGGNAPAVMVVAHTSPCCGHAPAEPEMSIRTAMRERYSWSHCGFRQTSAYASETVWRTRFVRCMAGSMQAGETGTSASSAACPACRHVLTLCLAGFTNRMLGSGPQFRLMLQWVGRRCKRTQPRRLIGHTVYMEDMKTNSCLSWAVPAV